MSQKKPTKEQFNKKTKPAVKPKTKKPKKNEYKGGGSFCSTMTRGRRSGFTPGESW